MIFMWFMYSVRVIVKLGLLILKIRSKSKICLKIMCNIKLERYFWDLYFSFTFGWQILWFTNLKCQNTTVFSAVSGSGQLVFNYFIYSLIFRFWWVLVFWKDLRVIYKFGVLCSLIEIRLYRENWVSFELVSTVFFIYVSLFFMISWLCSWGIVISVIYNICGIWEIL